MKFTYKAIDKEGKDLTGTREAADRFALAREMRAEGVTLTSAQPALEKPAAAASSVGRVMGLFNRVKIKDLIVFASSLQAMLGAGLPLARTLEVIERQTPNLRFKEIVASLNEKIRRGESLSKAMAAYPEVFPLVFVAMVEAGEESGKLPESVEIVRGQLAKSYDLRRKVKGAMIYPAIIVTVIIIIGIVMMIFLVPTLTALFRELKVELPLSTRLVIGTSDFMVAHTFILTAVLFLLSIGLLKLWRTARGQRAYAKLSLHLPAIKVIVKNLNAAITMRTMSSLISSGVSMLEAITITGKVLQNPYYKEILEAAGPRVEKGGALSEVFKERENLYPVLVGEMTEVGEETGNLSDMLIKGAVFFEEEVDQSTKNLSTIIEPVLMVLIGAAVALFAISIIGPIYSLTEAL